MKHGESGGPEPLTFTHNGQPATIDLERFKPQPQTEQPVLVEVKRPVAPEPLTFTHNGEPATINLERFQQQLQDEPLTFTHNGQPATVDLERFTRQAPKGDTHEARRNWCPTQYWRRRSRSSARSWIGQNCDPER